MHVQYGQGRFPVKGGSTAWTIILRLQEAVAPSLWTELAPSLDSPGSLCYTTPPLYGRIAQLVEQLTLNQRVPGSSPGAPTIVSARLFPSSHWTRLDQLGA